MRGFYWFLLALGLFLLATGMFTAFQLSSLGAFVKVETTTYGTCSVIADIMGPEALQLDREEGILYFISNNPCDHSSYRGAIYYLNLYGQDHSVYPFNFDQPGDFHPHGLSFFKSQDGEKYLFTNNHREDDTHTVEIFQIGDLHNLHHQQTVSGDALTSPNDLAAIGPNQFFLTNDGRSHHRVTRSVDTFLRRKTGNILYYNGSSFIEVASNLYFPNGIVLDHESGHLVVGETLSGLLKIYKPQADGSLEHLKSIYLEQGIDNLVMNDKQQLMVAVHPNLLDLSKHMKSLDHPSPSRVYQISISSGEKNIVYQNSGKEISGVSAVASIGNEIFLGTVCQNKLLRCQLE